MFCPNCEKHFGGDACPRCVTSVEGKWRVPYTRPSLPPWEDVKRSFEGIYKSGMLCHGSRVAEFEKGIAEYLDTTPSRVVACSNATTGLMLLCATLAAPGEVIMPGGRVGRANAGTGRLHGRL